MSLFCITEDLNLLRQKLTEEGKLPDSNSDKTQIKLSKDIVLMREKINQLESQLDKQEKREQEVVRKLA